MTDIVLISTPVMETRFPAPAIYYLKGALKPHGFSARCFDLVRDSEEYWGENSNKINSFLLADWHSGMYHDDADKKIYDEIFQYYEKYVKEKIVNYNPKWIGLSCFSQNSQKATTILSEVIRKVLPNVKIVVGGTGLGNSIAAKRSYGQEILNQGLVDYIINGEGEIALVELLKGNLSYPGINTTYYKQIDDLDSIPFPDYDDYIEDYDETIRNVTLTGSRGCVRACTFCDIGAFWKKYRYRSGKNIAEEMIRNKKQYGTKLNFFSDSLINGSMKAFREMCEVLADYHEKNPKPIDRIIWGGQFIIRSERQSPASDYQLMAEAGMTWASIGIESASEEVRNHMEKGYSNEDMYFSIDKLIENGVQVTLMFIVGYPTETEEMFQENIKFLHYYADRNSSNKDILKEGCVRDINLGQTLAILEGAPVADMDIYTGRDDVWVSKVVPGLDYGERFRRRQIIGQVAESLGYDVRWNEKQMHFLEKKLKHWQDEENKKLKQQEILESKPKSDTYCVLPWMSLATSASGNLRVCCNSTPGKNFITKEKDGSSYKIWKDDISEAWNSPVYKKIRRQMLNGERPEMCQRCFREEDTGIRSARQNWNDKWKNLDLDFSEHAEMNIKYVDIRLGNLCNLKCRMCNPYASNLWVDEYHLVDNVLSPEEFNRLKNMNWPEDEKTWDNLFSIANTVEEIYLTGGEPTIIKEQHKLLDYYIQNGTAKNIKLKYNTNLTNVPQHLIDRWKKFKRVQLNCSIDATGDLNRYIRYPSNWKKIVENFEIVQTLENVYIEIHCTVQMYNILSLNEFIDWAEPYRHKIYFNILNHPEELNIRVLPKELKEIVNERLLPYMHLDKVKGIIDYMNAEDWPHLLTKFQKYTNSLDKSRKQNLKEIHPELFNGTMM